MQHVSSPDGVLRESPRALVLVHGAGSGPSLYEGWDASFPSLVVAAVDLQDGLNVAEARHADYVANVVKAAAALPLPVALCGWSMGGLVVLQAAAEVATQSVVLIEPSPPAEVQAFNPDVDVAPGAFDPEEAYGPFPPEVRARPESALARAERKRGISVPPPPCPSLVIYGDEFPDQRGQAIARLYGSDELYLPGLDHWGLVCDRRVRKAIAAYLGICVTE